MASTPRTMAQPLTPVRKAPYEGAAQAAGVTAMDLYAWNSQISGAFFESLHYVEIGLRNAVDGALTRWARQRGEAGSWFDSPSCRLSPSSQRHVRNARERLGERHFSGNHGKLVAELSFGFWWSLLADEYNRTPWQPAVRFAFEGSVRRRKMHNDLDEIRLLRNRIAHHEPIHTRDLADDFARLRDVAERIAPALNAHIPATTRVPQVLASRPRA